MIRSIRFTLTLWYIGLLAVILCFFSGILYTKVQANIFRDVDELLTSQADGVDDTIFAFFQAERELAAKPSHRTIQTEIKEGRFSSLVSRWAKNTEELENIRPIRVIDRAGEVLIASKSFSKMPVSVDKRLIAKALKGRTYYQTFNLPDHRVRLVTWPVVEDNDPLYVVQVAVSLRQADKSLQELKAWLLWLIPLTLLVTSMIGWFLATLTLRPVGKIMEQAKKIGAKDLHERIKIPHTGDELERLALTFNEMLVRLERAFKRLRQFSAATSHELRTPLTIMKGELEVALRKPRDKAEYERVLSTQLVAVHEMAVIVEQLLTLAHSEEGDGTAHWRQIDLGELARQVRNFWSVIFEAKSISVEILEHEKASVKGEKTLLERLISNLMDNAIKHTPEKGRITVEIQNAASEVCFSLQDTGPGIAAGELPRVFEKFFSHSASSPDAPYKGLGLGLGLCRWIAEAHGGRIEVQNSQTGGALVRIYFPQNEQTVI